MSLVDHLFSHRLFCVVFVVCACMGDATPRSILVAVVVRSDTCTIAFCASMLKLQVQLARTRDVAVAIDFVASQDAAWAAFEAGNHETLVLLDSHMGVSPEFVLEEPASECVISPYPLPKLDWARAEPLLKDPACPHPEEAALDLRGRPRASQPVSRHGGVYGLCGPPPCVAVALTRIATTQPARP